MKKIHFNYISISIASCIMILLFQACEKYPLNSDVDFQDFSGEYLGEDFPDTVASRFCPDLFIENLHSAPLFSPDGSELYFKPSSSVGQPRIFEMKMIDGYWSKPFFASFNQEGSNDSPCISPDGKRMYFLVGNTLSLSNYKENVYYVSRDGDDWSEPKMLSDAINDFELHSQFSVASDYSLYFQDADNGDLYCSRYENGEYQSAFKLPEPINTDQFLEGSPWISPDESYLIFERRIENNSDLYISYAKDKEDWTEPAILSSNINTDSDEIYGYVTSDEKFLFFLRRTNEGTYPYWVDALRCVHSHKDLQGCGYLSSYKSCNVRRF